MTETKVAGPAEGDANPAIVETHISTVFFSQNRAYKLLKPLKNSFLDYSTIENRLKAVDQELSLNRRMAPDVYLGSADVIEEGKTVDRMIVMKRMPTERRLPELVGTNDLEPCVRAVARQIAVFHSAQEPIVDAHDIASRSAIHQNWHNNLTDMEPLVGKIISPSDAQRATDLVDRYIDYREVLFSSRLSGGFVRDGHGDLTAQDIFCLPDGPKILDCLAFDRKLRIADVLSDVAFLAMDLERIADTRASSDFINWYCEFTNEHHPTSLAHHYVAYRAHVRAKVAGIRYRQGDLEAAEEVQQYYSLCLQHLEQADPVLVLVGGTPGTGKTTLAQALSQKAELMALSTDELRKDLAGRDHLAHDTTSLNEGIYSPEMSERTYAELLRRAGLLLDRGESVILDASWKQNSHRAAALSLAVNKGAKAVELECVLDPEIAKKRISRRLNEGNNPSDARPELVDELLNRRHPWPTAVRVNTHSALNNSIAQATEAIRSVKTAR